MEKDYSSLYSQMQDENFVVSYKGQVGFVQINSLLQVIEDRLESAESNPKIRKKIYNIATECFQNLSHHLDKNKGEIGTQGLAIFEAYESKYIIATGNHIFADTEAKIIEKIDFINSLNKEELREHHKKTLANQEFSDKGTAGLGFIDIARKTEGKIIYKFRHVSEDISFFTLQVELERINNSH